jgi:hypothetical protein
MWAPNPFFPMRTVPTLQPHTEPQTHGHEQPHVQGPTEDLPAQLATAAAYAEDLPAQLATAAAYAARPRPDNYRAVAWPDDPAATLRGGAEGGVGGVPPWAPGPGQMIYLLPLSE